jgi:hypothetical protein
MIAPGPKHNLPGARPTAERYASGSVIARFDAKLVMDSRETVTSVRSQAFVGGWSKLYQAGAYYLDLSLKMDGQAAVLLGHVLPPVGEHQVKGRVRLDERHEVTIGNAGDFRIEVHPDRIGKLEVELEAAHLVVSNLSASA